MRGISLLLPLCIALVTGCVTKETHTQTLSELAAARKASAATSAELDRVKAQSAAERTAFQDEKTALVNQLGTAQNEADNFRRNLDAAHKQLYQERDARRGLEAALDKVRGEQQETIRLNGELRRQHDLLQAKADGLAQDLAGRTKALEEAQAKVASLERDKNALAGSLTDARDHARDLEAKLAAETAQVAALRDDKQRLLSGTTTAQDEIAKLQRRSGELEAEAARAADLVKRLEERDQEIGRLRQASSDRDALAAKAADTAEQLDKAAQRVATLTDELNRTKQALDAQREEAGRLAQERDRLTQGHAQLTEEQQKLLASLQSEQERLKAQEAERARLEQEREAKEEEIRRLTKAQQDLTKSLQDEIDKGNITIQQVRDRLTINMIDKVLFDSGQAHVKPAGLKVLKQVSDVLRDVPDKQIRIEGHTDNVPIGVKLREKFATNWELSTARATSVVRFLIEEGGIGRTMISAAGYADTRPVAENDSDEGKASNRRIEIVLYPKDLTNIANYLRADSR